MKLDSMETLFLHELKDLLSAEKQLVKALPKMAKGAADRGLKTAFQNHLTQTKQHVERLEQIFLLIGKSPRAEACEGMKGLLAEGGGLLSEEGDPALKDAALIGAAQRVEHYEIAAYGTARTFAEMLGLDQAVDLLQQTLDEEKDADEKLTELALASLKGKRTKSPSRKR